jgi:hypothetical protein
MPEKGSRLLYILAVAMLSEPPPVPVLHLRALFHGMCTFCWRSVLANDAGSCPDQPPEAEKTRLSIIGTVFSLYNNIIMSTNPRGPARDSACGDSVRRVSEDAHAAPRSAGNVTRQGPSNSDATPVSGLYAVSYAQVLQGVVTVAAPTPLGPIQNGFMEFVAQAGGFDELAVPVTEADAAGQHIYDPYQYKITFMKAAAGPSY